MDAAAEAQARVFTLSGAATITLSVLFYIGYFHFPLTVPRLITMADRLAFTLRWQVVSVIPIVAGILWVSGLRFSTRARNPMTGQDADKVEVHTRYLQNTIEQFVLSAVGQLALTTYLDQSQMKLIPILTIVFVLGRFAYWIGYCDPGHNRGNRVYGFMLTVLPTAIAHGYCLYRLFV